MKCEPGAQRTYDVVKWVRSRTDVGTPHLGAVVVVGTKRRPKWAILACPCGCGEILNVNLMRSHRPFWRLWVSDNEVTLRPSLWLRHGCRSHFLITDGYVDWMGSEEYLDWPDSNASD